jgi:hypothetical protein
MRMLVLGAGLQGSACAFDLLQNPDVREVRLADGRPLRSWSLPWNLLPLAATPHGLVVRTLDGALEVRDLATSRVRDRFGRNATLVDVSADRLAWLDDRDLHLHSLDTRRDQVLAPPAGVPTFFPFRHPVSGAGCCWQFGAFSPDGRTLAIYVQRAQPGSPGLVLVDVARGVARPLAGSEGAMPSGCVPCLGWRSGGDWLFFFAAGPWVANVAAYQVGARRAEVLDLDLAGATDVAPAGVVAS